MVAVAQLVGTRFAPRHAQAAAARPFRSELPYFVGDGSQRIVDVTIQPIRDAAGRVLFLAPTGVRHHRARRRTRRSGEDPAGLAADLAEADRRKNEFLAMLAHELRNPLAPISNAARALRLGGHDGRALRSASDMMERQVGQMSRLVDDLLDVSRITRGKIELRKERVELAPIVQQAVEAVARALPEHGPRADGDAAAAAGPPRRRPGAAGAGRRQPAEQRRQVHRHGRPHLADRREATATQAVIRVRDNGIGIAAGASSRPLRRCSRRSTRRSSARAAASGIGLTLVKTLVEMHGGTVEAHSDGPGRGSEFTVRLPVLHATPPGRAAGGGRSR